MELTNEQRRYLGVELIEPSWKQVEIPSNCVKPELSTGKIVLYFDGDVLRREISVDKNSRYLEESRFLKIQDNRSIIRMRQSWNTSMPLQMPNAMGENLKSLKRPEEQRTAMKTEAPNGNIS